MKAGYLNDIADEVMLCHTLNVFDNMQSRNILKAASDKYHVKMILGFKEVTFFVSRSTMLVRRLVTPQHEQKIHSF